MELDSGDETSKNPSISNPNFRFYNNFPQFWDDRIGWFSDVNHEIVDRIDVSVDEFKNLRNGVDVNDEIVDGKFKNLGNGVDLNEGIGGKTDYSISDFKNVSGREEMRNGVDLDDEIVGKIDNPIDELKNLREGVDEDGFQMVCGRKNRRNRSGGAGDGIGLKQKIPFHIASIPKPQDEFKIIVNNANQPFEHVWLERSKDGIPMHPLEKFSPLDFVDRNDIQIEPIEPPPLELTPFKIVEEVKDLKELAAKLRNVHEFAVDLEHNQYRSFQGLTCLMQISTRNEDFVIDTLKLRIHIGPYMRELFKDPTKRKVMHGADKDVLWLQRDFGIYICNMFDTMQASKVLNLERNSLEYLLNHFCGVQAKKEYQNADWRLRPLPDEMLKYAREDTHYLLYIYDLMRNGLLSLDAESACPGASLLEVYTRSYNTCMLLYEKDLLTEVSFRSVYGVPGAGLSAEQLAVVDALCEWRDVVARSEDESTGFILPNRTLVEIAKEVPLTTGKLRRFVRSKHPYVEHNLGSVVSIIRNAIQNSAAFEDAAVELKLNPKGSENNPATTEDEVLPEESENNPATNLYPESVADISEPAKPATDVCEGFKDMKCKIDLPDTAVANFQVLKNPSHYYGALLGSSSKKNLLTDKTEPEQMKLEQMISAVPFLPFVAMVEPTLPLQPSLPEELVIPETSSKAEDIISLNPPELPNGASEPVEEDTDRTEHSCHLGSASENEEGDDNMSLSDLSSSFQKCFQSIDESRRGDRSKKSKGHEGGLLQLDPFDYEAARKHVIFGKASRGEEEGDDNRNRSRNRNRNRVGKGQNRKSSSAAVGGQSQQ